MTNFKQVSLLVRGSHRALVAALAIVAVGAAGSSSFAQEVTSLQAAIAIEQALVASIERAEKSVVSIARVRFEDATAAHVDPRDPDFIPNEFATGVIVDRRGLVLTTYHVLRDDSAYYVTTADGRTYSAHVKGADPRSDLAILELDVRGEPPTFEPIEFGDAKTLKKGQLVVALGNPYAIARDGQASASWGIVSNLSRKAGPDYDEELHSRPIKTRLHHFGTLIQTDAKLNLGTSGGPLLNLKGEMVGLTTAEAALVGYEQSAGYAIPVDDTFLWVLARLKEGREVEYGFLGVEPMNLPPDSKMRGVRLNQIVAGTPAHEANLRQEDLVTAVNGVPIHDADGLMLQVGKQPVESVVRLTVERQGRMMQVTPILSKFPVMGKKVVTNPAPAWRGLQVDYKTGVPAFRAVLRDIAEPGVVVTEVEEDSPAWRAGVRPMILITHVAGVPVHTPRDFRAAVADHEGAVEIQTYQQGRERPVLVVEP